MPVFWNIGDWTRAIAALPVEEPLPCRTVLVPRERVAHGLRRDLVRDGHARALAGTRFKTTRDAAVDVLSQAGVDFAEGEEGLRPARILAIFHQGLTLEYFHLDHLRTRPGWDQAFARTIGTLEAAGLRPDTLDATTPQARDVAAVWRAAEASAAASWTLGRIYFEAATRAAQHWPYPGPTLATATTSVTEAEAAFLKAIPSARMALLAARPVRDAHVARIRVLLGSDIADTYAEGAPVPPFETEKDVLSAYLFTPPRLLLNARSQDVPRQPEVRIEEHAGVEDELEATLHWVGERVLEGTPLDEIAVLVPAVDPLATLVAERLQRLPTPVAVHVAGGLPLADTGGGARLLAVLRALHDSLSAESMAALLPYLQLAPATEGRTGLTTSQATRLAWSLGIVGGSPAHPMGALDWAKRVRARAQEIATTLQDPPAGTEDRELRALRHQLDDVRAVQPAIDALTDVAARVLDRSPLAELWPVLNAFLAAHLRHPHQPPSHALLAERMQRLATGSASSTLAGEDALRLVEELIMSTRVPSTRFGEPAVYVGTVTEAVGLRFSAVRVIGLAEGHYAAASSQDPVLPQADAAHDRILLELHALDACLRSAGPHVALSAPRVDLMRSERHPSFVLLEAAMALGRTRGIIPDAAALSRDYFMPSRDLRARALPLDAAAWLDAVARGRLGVPPPWREGLAASLDPVRDRVRSRGPLDGLVANPGIPIPGTSSEHPISPSSLLHLLSCPHSFLLQRLLKLEEPEAPPRTGEIQQPDYGTLVHAIAADFYERHGSDFLARKGTLEEWKAKAQPFIDAHFARLVAHYPLAGDDIKREQQRRLRRDVHALLKHDWAHSGQRRVLAVERDFGPLPYPADQPALYLKGRIDRIESDGDAVVVRDLKSGRPHPRTKDEADATLAVDLQIGVYALGARSLFPQYPRAEGAYVYLGADGSERGFHGDFHTDLEPALDGWLRAAASLLHAGLFPRTSTREDCRYCPFTPICGDRFEERARDILSETEALAPFAALKPEVAP